jgi:hypothetical protein
MQTLVNTVRATGATNVIMLGGLAYSNDLSQWLANKPTDSLNNLMASTHIYNFNTCSSTSCWASTIAPVAASVPVLAGEIGENDCAHGFIDTLMAWLDSEGIGYLAWAWDTYSCSAFPALVSDYTGTPTAYGLGLKNHLAVEAGVTPTPTTIATNTPTATATSTSTSTPTPTPTSTGTGSSCKVTYTITGQWGGGYGASIAIANTGSTAITSWSLVWAFANGQTVSSGWNGNFTQSGTTVTVTNVSYNGTIAAGATIGNQPGFNGTWNNVTNAKPTAFTLNGTACTVG